MMTAKKKTLIGFDAGLIPAVLKENKRWAPWAAVWSEKRGKYDKIPRRAANPEYGISTAKPDQWYSFDAALAAFERSPAMLAGVGYCMTGPHGVVGIDLDHCFDKAGKIEPWAMAVVDEVDSYTERSPSGNGLRILAFGEIAIDWTNHDQGIEVYGGHEPRFLTVTGAHLEGTPLEVRPVEWGVLAKLASRYAKEKRKAEVIDLCIPDVLDDLLLPDAAALPLPDGPSRFLTAGDFGADRSGTLHGTGVALYSLGLGDDEVFSILATNPYAMEVALDHRGQDQDRAMLYLWREHCVKAKPKASTVASPDEFDVVETPAGALPPLPPFRRDKKGAIEATVSNLSMALQRVDVCGVELRLDTFRDEIMYSRPGAGEWQPFTDADYTRLRIDLERGGFKPVGREIIRDAVLLVADDNQFDSAQEWLSGLQWDGVERIDTFYQKYFGVADSDYARAVSAYTWTALAGRVMAPGIKADMAPILVGAQGIGKSSAVAAMAPAQEFFAEVNLGEKDDDLSRKMRGCLVAEIGELRGLHTKESEGIKSFIARTHENWVPKYREFATKFPRRLLFIGTTNETQFLADPTGNRRWLPMDVVKADRDAVAADMAQLWAEGRERFDLVGIEYHQAEKLGREVHEKHMMVDAWESVVDQWLDEPDLLTGEKPRTRSFLRTGDVLIDALKFDAKNVNRSHEMRAAVILGKLGFERKKVWENGRSFWAFLPSLPTS